ncbi:MAG: glycosyltransferase [Nitrososphaeria archaeon]
MNDRIALVIGRHTEEPSIEGGGKITYQTAKALSEMGIKTCLISFNYANGNYAFIKSKTSDKGPINKLVLKMNMLSQDEVLNRVRGMLTSNLLEIISTPIIALRILRILNEKIGYIFIGNASKISASIIETFSKIRTSKTRKILMVFRREELFRQTVKMIKPQAVFVTSKELQSIVNHAFEGELRKNCFFAYPPVDEELLKMTELRISELGSYVFYMGRVSKERFPLDTFIKVLAKLKESSDKIKLVVAFPPERPSLEWFFKTKTIIEKSSLKSRVFFIPRILNLEEKASLLRKSSIFIYPAKTVAAIEPPLSVLESLAFGNFLIVSGFNSTRELAMHTKGQIFRDFSALNHFDLYVKENEQSIEVTKKWARENLSYKSFSRAVSKLLQSL